MEIPLLNSKFETVGVVKTEIDLMPSAISVPVVHQVVKSTLASRRQGTAATKNKALVQGGGKKPFKQKGTGRARQGSSRSPLMPGGGTIFGPTPRCYEEKVNKKVKIKAIKSILADKFQSGKLTILENVTSNGKTKEIFNLLNTRGLLPGLVVTSSNDSLVLRAMRNLKNGKALFVGGFSVYEALKYENLIFEKDAFEKILSRLV